MRLVAETLHRLVVLGAALCMIYFGYLNFLAGFGNFRMPSMTPLASLYAAIPLSRALIALFTVEQLVNGWRNGFAGHVAESAIERFGREPPDDMTANGLIVSMMAILVPDLRYLGVPVAFSLIAGVGDWHPGHPGQPALDHRPAVQRSSTRSH